MGDRIRKWNTRNVIARAFTAPYTGASPNFTARNGVDGSKDAAKIVFSVWGFSDRGSSESLTYAAARRAGKALLGRRVCT